MPELFYPQDQPTSVNGSTGSVVITAGNNVTLSQNASTITINAGGGANFSAGISGGNTSGFSGTVSNQIVIAGGNNITLSGNTNAGGMSVTIIAPNQSVQTQNVVGASISGNTAGVPALISSGTMIIAGGNNVTLSQNGQSISISAANQTVQTQNLVSINGSTGNISLVAGANISLSQNASTITISASNQSVQTQNVVDLSISGNTSGVVALISSGTAILVGGNNITLSQNGQSIVVSAANAGGAQTGISGVIVSNTTYTSGSVSFVNANGISFGSSGAQGISASYTVPVVPAQTNQTLGIYASSQTVGQSSSSTFDARSITFVGQGIISVGESAGSVILSATTVAQTNQSIGIFASSQTYGQSSSSTIDARSLTIVGQGALSAGMSGGSLMLSVAPGGQSNQTLSIVVTSNTTGNTSGATVDARSLTLQGVGIVSAGISTSAGGTSFIVSASQSIQTVGVYASSQTIGQSSSSTVDARSFTHVGQGIISVGLSGGSLLISATTPSQTNQTIGLYASSQTYGQSSSSTIDARSLSVVAQGAISAGISAGSLILSVAPGGQSNQTLSFALTGNTAGNTSGVSFDARSLTIQGFGAASVGGSTSAGGTSLLVSVAIQTNQTVGIYASSQTVGQSSSSTFDARSITLVGQGIISVGESAGSVILSASTAAQTNQSLGLYASSQTVGQSSSSTVDARSFTHVGQGIISVGMSGGSLLISATTNQTNQSIGIYASSQTYAQSSSSTVDARSLTIVGQGAISAGMSGGSLMLSVAPGAQSNQTLSIALTGNTAGNTSGFTVDARSLTVQGLGAASVGASTSAGGTSLLVSVAAQTNQTVGIYASSQTVGQSSSSTFDARSLSFVGQGIISVGESAGSILLSATTNQTNQSIGIYASSQTYGQSSSSTIDARSLTVVAQGAISAGMSGGSLVLSVSPGAQSNQTLSYAMTGNTTGNTSGVSIDARSFTVQGLGIASVGISTSAGGTSIIVSASSNQSNQTVGIYASSQTVGQSSSSTFDARSITLVGQGIISVGESAGSVILSATTVAQTNQSIGFYASSQTYGQSSSSTVDARSISVVGQGGISAGLSGGSLVISGPTTAAQTNQTLSFALTSNTTGNTSAFTIDARSLTLQGMGAVSIGASTSAGGTSLIVSAPNTIAQTNQSLGLYASSQTYGQSSSSTIDARSLTVVGQGGISAGLSGGSLVLSAPTTVAQTNQTLGLYASSQTVGQSSSSTVDARSFTHVGQGIISVGMSGGSLLISATTPSQTNQTLSFAITSNTTGNTSGLGVDARSLTLQGAGIISVGLSTSAGGSSIIISASAAQTVQSIGIYASSQTVGQSSSSTFDARSLSLVGQGIISIGESAGSVIFSATTVQSNQSMGLYALSQTYGQSSSSTIDARSLSVVAQGELSVGISAGSLVISAPTDINAISISGNSTSAGAGYINISAGTAYLAGGNNITLSQNGSSVTISAFNQSNQTLGLFASSNTTGQSSSTTIDARSITFVGQGVASVGMSGGSVLISVPSGGGGGFTGGFSTLGNTSGNTGMVSNQMVFAGINNVTLSGSTGANSITISISGPTISTAQLVAAGNTTGTLVTLSSGYLSIAAGNNITLSQDGTNQSILISANAEMPIGISTLGNTSGTTGQVTGNYVLIGGNNITVSQSINGQSASLTISQQNPAVSYFEPPIRGSLQTGAASGSMAFGTVYLQPFFVYNPVAAYRLHMYQNYAAPSSTTFSVSASISAGSASSGTVSVGTTGTIIVLSRVSTGPVASSSQLASMYSNSYQSALGLSISVSWSTNVSSCTASFTTSGAVTFISQIDSAGGVTTGSFGTSGSTSFSSTSNGINSFSSSFVNTFGSLVMSGFRPIIVPFNTTLAQGEYWLGHLRNSTRGSTNYISLSNVLNMNSNVPIMAYSTTTQGYVEIGATVTNNSSNIMQGWGSYSLSANTTATSGIPIANISAMSQLQTWFNMMAVTK